jgi:hypothetical protein
MVGQLGYFEALRANYLEWQGRYTSSSILFLAGYLSPSAFLVWYWLIPTSVILSVGASSYVLMYYLNRFALELAFTRRQIFVASLVHTSIYLVSLDRPSEVVYWFSGSITYQVANVFFTLLLAVLVRLYFAQSITEKCFFFVTSVAFLLFIVGCNETILVTTLAMLAFSMFLVWSQTEKHTGSYRIMLACLLVIGVIASLVVILAPGNSLRIQYEENTWGWHKANSVSDLLQAGIRDITWVAISSLRWLLAQPYHAFGILIGLAWTSRLSWLVQVDINNPRLLWLSIISFVLVVAAAFPSFALGILPPERTRASIYLIFWLSFIPSGVALMKHYRWELHGRGFKTALKVALVGSILLNPHYVAAVQDFKDAVLYRLQVHERQMIVNSAVHEGNRDLVVPKLKRVPATIHVRDLSEDITHYYNRSYALYFGLNSIVAQGDQDTSRLVQQLKEQVRSQINSLAFWKQ